MDKDTALLLVLCVVVGLVVGYIVGVRKQFNWQEFIRLIRWPAAILFAFMFVFFVLEFRQPIVDDIERANTVEVRGVKVTLNRPGPNIVDQKAVRMRLVKLGLFKSSNVYDSRYNQVAFHLEPTKLGRDTQLYLREVLATTVKLGH